MEEEFQFEQLTYKKQRHNNDFGQGFYIGESYEQAISFVSGFDQLSCCNKSWNAVYFYKRKSSVSGN
ncbi:DUF3990 domain-containing protein [Blautia sp.]